MKEVKEFYLMKHKQRA